MIFLVRDDPSVVDLVVQARGGNKAAWDQIVTRYASLVWSVCHRHGLSGADAEDVGGGVWLRLVEHLDTIREPAALPGWIATTTQRECLQLLRNRKRQIPVDDPQVPDDTSPASDHWLLIEEREDALRRAFAGLQPRCQQLLSMLFADPSTPYLVISTTLEMPIGAIGPNRKRCLDRLRQDRALGGFRTARERDFPEGAER
jgi:RNA polymerase sigma factor (sigma-70 family)